MAEVVRSVKNSGGVYPTFTAWVAGEQRVFGTDEVAVAEVYNDFPSGMDDRPILSGFTNTGPTQYVEWRAAPGQKHDGTFQSGARINAVTGTGFTSKIQVPYTRLVDLEIHSPDTGAVVRLEAANITIDGCILNSTGTFGATIMNPGSTGGHTVKRSVVSHTVTNVGEYCISFGGGAGITLDQCTIGGTVNIDPSATNLTARNCVIAKADPSDGGWSYSAGSIAAGSGNNAAYNGATVTPPGANPYASNVVDGTDIADAANDDFSLPSGSNLTGIGQDLSGVVDNDIIDNALSAPYPIGAFAAPSAAALAGDATGAASATGVLTTAIPVVGASLVVATASGALSTAIPFAGSASASASAGANVDTGIQMAGDAAVVATGSADLGSGINLGGNASGIAAAIAALDAQIKFSGGAAGAALAGAGLTSGINLQGQVIGTGSASGDLSGAASLSGDAVASAIVSGVLDTGIPMVASASVSISSSGDLTAKIQISGAALIRSLAQAGLSSGILMTAAATGTAAAQGNLIVGSGLFGDASANALSQANITTQVVLSGEALNQALAQAGLTAPGAGLSGSAIGSAQAAGVLTTDIPLAGNPSVVAKAAGGIDTIIRFQGAAAVVSKAIGGLNAQITFNAGAVVRALASGSIDTSIDFSGIAQA
ncbi:MAG: hypothetical protein ACU843_07460, partial [Gammaproteobacteria bacterium]